MSSKFYAVREGRVPGIYTSWDACRLQVHGYPSASYKSFSTRAEAEAFMKGDSASEWQTDEADIPAEAYVDGSYDAASGSFSYGMVLLVGGEEKCFSQKVELPELADMRNVAGEIKGAEAAMRYALEQKLPALVIYHDYEGIAKWCTGEWKATKPGTQAYRDFYLSIRDRLRVRFVKVKGHSGVRYNEMADELAKQALGLEKSK